MTLIQIVFLAVFYAIAIAMGGHLLLAWWLLARSETRLREGLEPQDVDTHSNEPVDESYLAVAGRADRQRGWRLLRRGLFIGALTIPVFGAALLLHIGFTL